MEAHLTNVCGPTLLPCPFPIIPLNPTLGCKRGGLCFPFSAFHLSHAVMDRRVPSQLWEPLSSVPNVLDEENKGIQENYLSGSKPGL